MAHIYNSLPSSTRALLEVVRREKEQLVSRLAEIEEREKTILSWIEREEGIRQPPLFPAEPHLVRAILKRRSPTATSLSDFFRGIMRDGIERTNQELGDIAGRQGIVEGKVDLRSVNVTMVNLMTAGEVERRNNKWVRKDP